MATFTELATRIVKEQQVIIGPVALEVATKIKGLTLDTKTLDATINGDEKKVIDSLVKGYEALFGQASVDVCRDAAKEFIAKLDASEVPSALKS